MIYRYLINAIIIFLCSQKISSGLFLLKKKRYFINNVFCVLLFEEIIVLLCQLLKIKDDNIIDIIVLITTILFFYLLSISCYYVHEFRGTNLNFQDLLSIGTAKEVASGYKYIIYKRFIIILMFYILYITFNIYAFTNKLYIIYYNDVNWHPILLIVLLICLRITISKKPYDYSLFAGEKEGYIYNFFTSIKLFHRSENKKYDEHIYVKYINDKDEYNRKNAVLLDKDDKPYVICVMNESFGFSHELIKTNKEVTPYYNNLSNVIKGNMYVNTIGGGTCNTEYDFLTYSNTGDFAYPIYPFNNLVKKNMYAFPRYFKNKGYKTLAFHPYTKSNYNRVDVYKRFGFDDFIGIDDMDELSYIRNFVSDECMYNEILSRVNKSINNKDNLFLYAVSIQNHGGYSRFDSENIKCIDNRFYDNEIVNSYLSLIKKSDDAIHILIDGIKNIEKRVILLFFGDHNATYNTYINKKIYGENNVYEMTDAYRVPFFIYDNKINRDEYIECISPNFLAQLLIDKSNLSFDYDLYYMNNLYKEIDCMNYHRIKKKNNDVKYDNDLYEYKVLQKYFVLKGKRL